MPAGFPKAQSAFRDHAAQALEVQPSTITVSPSEEDPLVQLDERVGQAWAFAGFRNDDPDREVRAWAIADGTVITPEQNLGILFEEAGVWTSSPKLTALELAKRIVWAKGMGHRVLIEPNLQLAEPSLQVGADGAGTFKFFVGYKQPGPGGAGGGPEQVAEWTVTLTADHKAQLQKGEWRWR